MKKLKLNGLFFEVLIIFIGLSAAFFVDDLRDQKREDQIRINFYNSFILELEEIRDRTVVLKEAIDTLGTALINRPEMEIPYRRNFDFTNNLFIIHSAFGGDNFTAVGPEYLRNIEFGANNIKVIEKRFNILDAETRRYILKSEKTKEEKSKFREWYLSELEFISFYLEQLVIAIEKGAIPDTQAFIESIK